MASPRDGSSARSITQRATALISSAFAALLGLLPHILHHAGPLAGAALLAGTAGTLLFGAIGLIAAVPFLIRVHRRCGNWKTPAALLALFAGVFLFSSFVLGPAISGEGSSSSEPTPSQSTSPSPVSGHDAHHE